MSIERGGVSGAWSEAPISDWMGTVEEQALVLRRAIYQLDGCGCCLHIVLDDYNVDDDSVVWCLANAIHGVCRDMAMVMLRIPEEKREAIAMGALPGARREAQ